MSFNFLKSFCSLLENTEVPPRFQIWSGISTLLAMLERRVWIPQGVFNVYPNSFIILIAASGQKKSTPINLAERLIRRVTGGPNVVAQKISPEALISSIKATETKDSKNLLAEKCGGLVVADELATFLDRGALDRGLGPILTKLYDCSPFKYETLKRGTETIEGGYLSILGGTTVELLRSSLPKDAIGGGFTSRTIFVYEDKISPPVPWVMFNEELMGIEEQLVEYLTALLELKGPISITAAAKDWFEADYKERYYKGEFRHNGALQGYENRRAGHLFKVAMSLMIAEEPGMILTEGHLRGAKVILEEAEQYMPHVMDLITASDIGAQGNLIFTFIKSKGKEGCTRSELVRHFGTRMDALEIAKVIDTLRQGNRIDISTTHGGKLVYRTL